MFGAKLKETGATKAEPEVRNLSPTRKDVRKMDYLVKSMKQLNLTSQDIEKSLPCSIGLLTSRNPLYLEGTSVFNSEIEHARRIPQNKRRLLLIQNGLREDEESRNDNN